MDNIFATVANSCREIATPFIDNFAIKSLLGAFGFAAGVLFGAQFFQFIGLVVALVFIDGLTGIWAAWKRRELRQSDLIRTVPKLIRYLIFIIAGNFLSQLIPFNIGVVNVIIVFVGATEFLSVARNLNKLGMPLPKNIIERVEDLRTKQ